jgi:hypothetical protein
MHHHPHRIFLSFVALALGAGCSSGTGNEATAGTGGAGAGGAASGTGGAGGTTPSSYTLDCQGLASLFVSTPTPSVNDWSGYFDCYSLIHGCSGTTCTWNESDLPSYLLDDDCATGATQSCVISGKTVPHCATRANTGSVVTDCSTSGKITVTSDQGFPDHTMLNFSAARSLPPGGPDGVANKGTYTVTLNPTYDPNATVFSMPGNSPGVMLNGVNLFNQFTGISTIAVEEEFVDDCGGHGAPNGGAYHYHQLPSCGAAKSSSRLGGSGQHSGFMGLTVDGFPILGPYGYADPLDATSQVVRLDSCYKKQDNCSTLKASCFSFDEAAYKSGTCHLDQCNGRVTAVPAAMQAALGKEIYAFYFTLDAGGKPAFPYLPYCFRGTTSSSSTGGMTGGGPTGGGPTGGGPTGGGSVPTCMPGQTMCCGDGTCEGPETHANCPSDCP